MISVTTDTGRGPEKHYTLQDAAQQIGITRQWLAELADRGDVESHTLSEINRSYRWVSESEIKRVKESRE